MRGQTIFGSFCFLLCLVTSCERNPEQSWNEESISIREVASNTGRTGRFPLSEKFTGKLSYLPDSFDLVDEQLSKFSFEFALLGVEEGYFLLDKVRAPRQAITVRQNASFWGLRPATSIQEIPSLESIQNFDSISEYKELFGPTYFPSYHRADEAAEWSDMHWVAFEILDARSIRVVSAKIWIIHFRHRDEGWKIRRKQLGEGIFEIER